MAVLDTLPGVSVSVIVDDEDVMEYNNPDDQPRRRQKQKKVIKYVEAESDKSYAIKIESLSPRTPDTTWLCFELSVDGVGAQTARINPTKSETHLMEGMIEMVGDRAILFGFKFTSIARVDDSDKARVEKDRQQVAGVGEIRVEVYRQGKAVKRENTNVKQKKNEVMDEDAIQACKSALRQAPDSIAEKAAKGESLSHGTSYEDGTVLYNSGSSKFSYTYPYLDGSKKPIAVFVFKYRSRDSLKQMLVIPRTPSPDPVDTLTQEELRNLARRELDRQKSAHEVKSEIKNQRSVKRERIDDDEIESIDMTGDEIIVQRTPKKAKLPSADQVMNLD